MTTPDLYTKFNDAMEELLGIDLGRAVRSAHEQPRRLGGRMHPRAQLAGQHVPKRRPARRELASLRRDITNEHKG